ncbi:sn-glycerol-3-phosphate ABC transporter ATP-binding protein UgpC [Roseovarius indicus]|uniref:Glycerol-3-phosphate transporter ATP-binding subunit n=1 Tax=Roseovarius indicus TaxID=540747 RepID=A0A0T5P5X8_9RHOB|nr:sn-glycerol-3-phosphate ABC transporter ATP-binding protein UgpC [Roseovarius indicus]KRS16417.1 glycerol-3-phosphate transporter ATP-binding subunit [Roseovarius indicus]QEW28403.1 sn-glycerol-3-phosphate import ATP-binding protein UgpC [Roseovarius indicus]SFE11349.1 carbohydrate ABC transporter ATP-binding protein, CUT1 family [Roseovarius indicus]
MSDIAIEHVRKVYPGGVEVIPDLSLSIAAGELCVLVGPSGCGKSTLLRMVAGLETVTGGDISIGGRRVNDLEPVERDISMVFQNYALYPHMTVYDNMAYGLRNRGEPKDRINAAVHEAAKTLGLSDFLDRKPRQLSGGQRQRVAMGRAIVRDPTAFLFDEPLSNLDAKLRVKTRVEIRALQQRLGTTSIYVTHDQLEAMTLADKLVIMNAGQIEQAGPPLEIYENPASVFVAGFIGSPPMNFLPGTVTGDGITLETGHTISPDRPAVGPLTVGIRPEHLTPGSSGPLTLQVQVVERLGATANVHGVLEGTQTELVASITGTEFPQPGEVMPLSPTPGALRYFSPETGQRLA